MVANLLGLIVLLDPQPRACYCGLDEGENVWAGCQSRVSESAATWASCNRALLASFTSLLASTNEVFLFHTFFPESVFLHHGTWKARTEALTAIDQHLLKPLTSLSTTFLTSSSHSFFRSLSFSGGGASFSVHIS